ncbi:MAG TPA: hypothetical protein VHN99_12090, partial [Deinococcales bacterium]|nr:hypothetical protein [Deinococcales bacterium]
VLAYMRNKGKRAVKLGRELAVASAITLLLVVTSLGYWAPVKQLMAFGNGLDTYWTARATANGYHVPAGEEELPKAAPSTTTAPTPSTAAASAPAGSPSASSGAASSGATSGGAVSGGAVEVRTGFGRFTVQGIADRYGIPLSTATARLAARGLRDARPDDTLLALSGRSGYSPSDLDAIVQDKPLVSVNESAR